MEIKALVFHGYDRLAPCPDSNEALPALEQSDRIAEASRGMTNAGLLRRCIKQMEEPIEKTYAATALVARAPPSLHYANSHILDFGVGATKTMHVFIIARTA